MDVPIVLFGEAPAMKEKGRILTHSLTSLSIEFNERETIVNRVGRDPNEDASTLFRIRPRISWRWRREWELAGEYEYVDTENELSRKARRNAAYLTLTYLPTKLFVSR